MERLATKNRLGYKGSGFGDLQKNGIFVGVEFYVKCFWVNGCGKVLEVF
jgi:hypothetical protein